MSSKCALCHENIRTNQEHVTCQVCPAMAHLRTRLCAVKPEFLRFLCPEHREVSNDVAKSEFDNFPQLGGLRIGHLSINSLLANGGSKRVRLAQLLSKSNLDILFVSETWLKEEVKDENVTIDGYKHFRNDRTADKSGGILAYCRKCIKVAPYHRRSYAGIELLWLELAHKGAKILLGSFCIPKKPSDAEAHLAPLKEDVRVLTHFYPEIILLGDFNVEADKLDFLTSRSFAQLVQQENDNHSDHIWTNQPEHMAEWGVFQQKLSERSLVYCYRDCHAPVNVGYVPPEKFALSLSPRRSSVNDNLLTSSTPENYRKCSLKRIDEEIEMKTDTSCDPPGNVVCDAKAERKGWKHWFRIRKSSHSPAPVFKLKSRTSV